jgi:hypothetical protein
MRPRLGGNPAHDLDQLGVCAAGRIAEFIDRMGVGKLAQPDELQDPLPPVQRQFGRPTGDQEVIGNFISLTTQAC